MKARALKFIRQEDTKISGRIYLSVGGVCDAGTSDATAGENEKRNYRYLVADEMIVCHISATRGRIMVLHHGLVVVRVQSPLCGGHCTRARASSWAGALAIASSLRCSPLLTNIGSLRDKLSTLGNFSQFVACSAMRRRARQRNGRGKSKSAAFVSRASRARAAKGRFAATS